MFEHFRRTKIVATIGPACDTPEGLASLIDAGMNVARISTAHDSVDVVVARIEAVKRAAATAGVHVATMVDLAGPKLRFASCGSEIVVAADDEWEILQDGEANQERCQLAAELSPHVWKHLAVGTQIAVGDGAIRFEVVENVIDRGVRCRVLSGGVMRGRPGLHVPSDLVDIPSPTQLDFTYLSAAVAAGVDAVAVSFVRTADDVRQVSDRTDGQMVIAKIETAASVRNLKEIVGASDAVMTARGDLGLEFELCELPFLQREIVEIATTACRPVITATQMLESMVSTSVPTRAEAADVSAAVLGGTSAVMLSGETAVGVNPALAVKTMASIAARSDLEIATQAELPLTEVDMSVASVVTHAISGSAPKVAEEVDAAALVCLTERGFTARALARWRPKVQLLAATKHETVARQLAMSWGVTPYVVASDSVEVVLKHFAASGVLDAGDVVVAVTGPPGQKSTDTLSVTKVD